MADHRQRWRVWQRFMDPTAFVFLDETGATTNMARRYGWSPRGERLIDAAPFGHWRTTTFIAGLRSTGIIAPLVLDGPMTGETFRAYVEQFLAPALSPGDVVVLDNLSAHKVAGVREAIAAVGRIKRVVVWEGEQRRSHSGSCFPHQGRSMLDDVRSIKVGSTFKKKPRLSSPCPSCPSHPAFS